MAWAPPAPSSLHSVTFFGTCPTPWTSLTIPQKLSCSKPRPLLRQVQGHTAWRVDGELRTQWEELGHLEYSQAIGPVEKLQRPLSALVFGRKEGITLSYDIRLLSASTDRESAKPYIVFSTNRKSIAEAAISNIREHPIFSGYHIEFLICITGIEPSSDRSEERKITSRQLPVDKIGSVDETQREIPPATRRNKRMSTDLSQAELLHTSTEDNPYVTVSSTELPAVSSPQSAPRTLCGARIAVYAHKGHERSRKKSHATIGAILKVGDKHYALTAAHAFYGDTESTESWFDSGLFVRTTETGENHQSVIPTNPQTFAKYEVVVENFSTPFIEAAAGTEQMHHSLGLVAPAVTRRRKDAALAKLPLVILDRNSDWALIELQDNVFQATNTVDLPSGQTMILRPPSIDQTPPDDELLLATGFSGLVTGAGIGTTGGIILPWSTQEIKIWSVECEIAVGDCGSLAVDPQNNEICGMVVAHDPDTSLTYVVPAQHLLSSIAEHFQGLEPELSTTQVLPSANTCSVHVLAQDEHNDISGQEVIPDRIPRPATSPPDYENVVADFLTILRSLTLRNVDGRNYIRTDELVKWLLGHVADVPRLEYLLESAYQRPLALPIEPSQISSSRGSLLLIFALLLQQNCGQFVHLFRQNDLTDNKLPFDQPTLNHLLESDSQLASRLYEAQWAYCPMIFDIEMDRYLPSRTVVPIHSKQIINNKGARAKLSEITVLEDFVSTDLRSVLQKGRIEDTSDGLGSVSRKALAYFGDRYVMALKSYPDPNRELFRIETSAFKVLRNTDGMIRYLGSYTQRTFKNISDASDISYNVLLEYGQLDLDEYFHSSQAPPTLSTEIILFWRKLSAVVDAVAHIHEVDRIRAGRLRRDHGWHSDIKPDNILLVNGRFKLADPGMARFETSAVTETTLVGGTVTYGAPEVEKGYESYSREPVSRATDIWSLGCVLSLAATWVIGGSPALPIYHRLRLKSTKGSHSRESSDSFHNGQRVLPEVTQWHAYLRGISRRSDTISGQILDLVDDHMLVADPLSRATARRVSKELQHILETQLFKPEDLVSESFRRLLTENSQGQELFGSGESIVLSPQELLTSLIPHTHIIPTEDSPPSLHEGVAGSSVNRHSQKTSSSRGNYRSTYQTHSGQEGLEHAETSTHNIDSYYYGNQQTTETLKSNSYSELTSATLGKGRVSQNLVPITRKRSVSSMKSNAMALSTSTETAHQIQRPLSGPLTLPTNENLRGFCKGAFRLQAGMEKKAFVVANRPVGYSGMLQYWKCDKCYYEGPCQTIIPPGGKKPEKRFDPTIHEHGGIRYKWAFLAKCHVPLKTMPEGKRDGLYGSFGCIFCTAESAQRGWPAISNEVYSEREIIKSTGIGSLTTKNTAVFGNIYGLMDHLQMHRYQDFWPGIEMQGRIKCVIGRVAQRGEDFDINFMPVV